MSLYRCYQNVGRRDDLNKIKTSLLILTMLPVLAGSPQLHMAWAQANLDVDELAADFFCSCGCNYLLSVCESQMTCDVASDMKSELRTMVNQGMSRDEIVDVMTSRYGNAILAIPPMQGFSLALWWYPVIGGILGVFIITMVSRRRSGVNWRIDPDEVVALNEDELLKQIDVSETTSESTVEKKYDDLLKKKLKAEK